MSPTAQFSKYALVTTNWVIQQLLTAMKRN